MIVEQSIVAIGIIIGFMMFAKMVKEQNKNLMDIFNEFCKLEKENVNLKLEIKTLKEKYKHKDS